MADTVVKTVEDVDKLFSQIVVNGETYDSNRYVPPAPVQVIEEPEPEPRQTEPSQNPSVPSGQTIQGEDVYAVVLNDEQHNFVDPEEVSSRTEADTTLQGNINSINALIPSDTTTTNKLVNESGIQDAVDTAVENAVADLDVPSVGGNGKYIKAISETNGKISATEGTIADTVESGNNNPVTSDAVNSAIQSSSGDVSQQIAQAIGALDVASTGGSGKYISAISETDGKISATEGNIDSSVTDGSSNPVTGGAVSSAITNAIGALDVASAGGSGKYISAISETDGKINTVEGTIDNAVNQNSSNPVTGGAVKTAIDNAISSVYKPAGDKAVADLTSALLTAQNLGNVYNITDSGTTTSDFVEGAGHPIKAGDNVAVVDVGAPSSPSYKFDLIGGFIDLSNYIQKSQTLGLIKNDGSVDTTAYAKQSEMSVTPGTGTDSDKTTIQLKTGTSATVLTQHIPAGSSTPVMDGTGSAGSSTNYARADHVHPKDTSKQDVLTFDEYPTRNSSNPVKSGGVYANKTYGYCTGSLNAVGWYRVFSGGQRNKGISITLNLSSLYYYNENCSHIIQISSAYNKVNIQEIAKDIAGVFDKIRICYGSSNTDPVVILLHYTKNQQNNCYANIFGECTVDTVNLEKFVSDTTEYTTVKEFNLGTDGTYINGEQIVPITVDSALSPTSTNPVQNKVINSALDGKADTEDLTIPTDAVLHYSFDELPDYPDGTADVRLLDNNTYDIQATGYKFLDINNHGTTFTNVNGNVQITIPTGSDYGAQIRNAYIVNKIIKLKINVTSISGILRVKDGTGTNGITLGEITQNGIYEYTFIHDSSPLYNNFYFLTVGATSSATFTVEQIYIGDGSYSTPVIDNANGQNNAVNNGGIAVQGVSGKGLRFFGKSGKYIGYNDFILGESFTFSFWVNYKSFLASNEQYNLVNYSSDSGSYGIRIGSNNGTKYGIYVNSVGLWKDILSTLSLNTDYHFVVCFENGIFNCYVNGEKKLSFSGNPTYNTNKLTICGITSNVNYTADCIIDDFLIFDRALSDTEVQALYYNKANTPKYYDLADYQLNSGEVVKSVCSQLPDSSGNVALTKSDVGLGNVENTGDSAVPVQNGTTKFTTGGAFDFFGKSASSASWLGKVFGRLMGRKWTQVTAWDSYTRTPTYANGLWVVGSSYHGLYWSEDGRTWTQCTGTSSLNLDSPVYANGLWVSSKQYWSTDGKSWTQGTGVNGELRVPIYANGLWVAGNFIDKGMWWSTDGKSWTQGTGNNTTCYMETPTYANGLWVAGNSIGDSTNGGLWWSTDGKSWTQGTGNNTTYSMKSPTYADGLWVAGSGAGNIYGAKGLWWSTDGKSWTQGTGNNTTLSMESPVFVDGLWISGAYEININLWKSTDGKDWTLINDTSSLLTPKYANEVWIAGSNKKGIWWSVNGLEWKQAITTSYYTRTPNYANGLWITGCDTFSGGIYYSDIEMALEDLTD